VDRDLPIVLIALDYRTVFAMGRSPDGRDLAPDPPLDSTIAYGVFRRLGDATAYWTSIPVRGSRGEQLGWIAQRRYVGNAATRNVLQTLIGNGIRLSIGQVTDSVWVDFGGEIVDSPPRWLASGEPFTFREADGTEVLAIASALRPAPWVLLLQTPIATVRARPRAFRNRIFAAGALLTILTSAIAWRGTGRLTGPLNELAAAATHAAGGNYQRRVQTAGGDEVGRLGEAFNAMSDHVARSDEALRRRLDEQQALSLRLARAKDDAEHANRTKSEFMATMSHEIRTPINAVLGYTQLLEQGIPDPPTKQQLEYLRRIDRSSRLLLTLVNDVLDFARIESGRMHLDRGPGSAREALITAIATLEPVANRKEIRLTMECEDDGRFWGDQQRVQQILLNLLSNAVKYTPMGGSVSVHCSSGQNGPDEGVGDEGVADDGTWVRIDVVDTGIGIEPAELERMFEPFEQARTGLQRDHGGVGLGLPISRRLAVMMSGAITAKSTPGKGSTFTLWLPGSEPAARTGSAALS
jgi:signal transduction histidine kinase